MKVSPCTAAAVHACPDKPTRGDDIVPGRKEDGGRMPAPLARHSRRAVLKGASAGVAAATLIGLSSMYRARSRRPASSAPLPATISPISQ